MRLVAILWYPPDRLPTVQFRFHPMHKPESRLTRPLARKRAATESVGATQRCLTVAPLSRRLIFHCLRSANSELTMIRSAGKIALSSRLPK